MTEESIAEVDVVSQSFVIPPDVNKEDIVIKIAKCSTKVEKTFIEDGVEKTDKFFIFEEPKTINIFSDPKVLSGYTYDKKVVDSEGHETGEVLYNTPVDGSLSLDFAKSDSSLEKEDMVTLTGFNYGALFCGPVYDEGWTAEMEGSENHIDHYTGYKVILEIPIKMNPKAVGGPDVDTNAEGSGIKIGNSTIPFRSPHVSLPVNIWIRKDGLEVGESAKFIIERAVIPSTWPKLGDEDYPTKSTDGRYDALSWEPVSSVFVTRHKGQDQNGVNAPVTKAVGLPSVDDQDNEFIYRIIESTDWSWSYTQGTTSIFTTDLLETNPFIFYNTKKYVALINDAIFLAFKLDYRAGELLIDDTVVFLNRQRFYRTIVEDEAVASCDNLRNLALGVLGLVRDDDAELVLLLCFFFLFDDKLSANSFEYHYL